MISFRKGIFFSKNKEKKIGNTKEKAYICRLHRLAIEVKFCWNRFGTSIEPDFWLFGEKRCLPQDGNVLDRTFRLEQTGLLIAIRKNKYIF